MQKQKNQTQAYKNLYKQLSDMGFAEELIKQSLLITTNKEAAIQYIIKNLQQSNLPPNKEYKLQVNKQNKVLAQNQDDFEDVEEEHKMVFLVRMDLKMGIGKIAAQVGHATIGAYKQLNRLSQTNQNAEYTLNQWMQTGQKKIVLKVNSQQEMFKIVSKAQEEHINYYIVKDAGRTQIKPGSITVCGLGPASCQTLDKITGHLKLL